MASKLLDSTAEHTKYGRMCRMVVELCRDMLWEVLMSEIPINELPRKIRQNLHKLRINNSQKHFISTPGNLQSNKDVDITIVYTILRNICCGIEVPSNGWYIENMGNAPGMHDNKLGDDIERIHIKRNILYGHAKEARLDESTYTREVADLRAIASRMDSRLQTTFTQVLKAMEECSMDSEKEKEYIDNLQKLKEQEEEVVKRIEKVEDERSGTFMTLSFSTLEENKEVKQSLAHLTDEMKKLKGESRVQEGQRFGVGVGASRTTETESATGGGATAAPPTMVNVGGQGAINIFPMGQVSFGQGTSISMNSCNTVATSAVTTNQTQQNIGLTSLFAASARPIIDVPALQRQLISMYEDRRLDIPLFFLHSKRKIHIEDIYVEQHLKVVDPDGRLTTDLTISMRVDAGKSEQLIGSLKDVFYTKNKKCRYIYVSGNAGYGKSVFCSHLIRLWSLAHSDNTRKLTPDEELMAKYPLLFCVDLKDAKYDGTDEMCSLIHQQLQLSQLGLTDNDISRLLQAEGQVLVVMDALDECKEERLPRGGLYNKCTTLVTSRPWKLEALRCDPEYRVDKELEIVGLKKECSGDLSKNLVKLLNEKWNKRKRSTEFITKMHDEGLEEFLNVPVLLISMLCLWYDDVPFGQSQIQVYRNSIHHQILIAKKLKDIPEFHRSNEAPFPVCQREKCPCKCFGDLLWKVSELACKALLGNVRERSLVMDHDQTEVLGLTGKEVAICMKLGILTQYKLLGNLTDYDPQKSVSFTHKTYQEWFAAVYLSTKCRLPELDNLLLEAVDDLDSALELDQIFLFVCGLNAEVAARLSGFIMSKVSSDARVQEYRRSHAFFLANGNLIRTIQDVVVAGAVEAKNNKTTPNTQLHDVFIRSDYSVRFSPKQILACGTSHARSVNLVDVGKRKITPWPSSSCLERIWLRRVNNVLDSTFYDNFSAAHLAILHMDDVTLTHGQLECLALNLALAGSLRTVDIKKLTCVTHTHSRHECSIMLDLSQHQGLEHLTLRCIDVGQVLGICLCEDNDKLEEVQLRGFSISAAALRQTLEALPGHCVKVELGYCGPPLRVTGAKEATDMFEEIREANLTRVIKDIVNIGRNECTVMWFEFYNAIEVNRR